ncbi:MAG TPA: cysteine desulfurase family protein [Candidatus Paceibacterota bacterium]
MAFFKYFQKQTQEKTNERIYLDVASSTPVDLSMIKSFPVLSPEAAGANPSALHKEGVAAKHALFAARALVAQTLLAHDDEIIFTSNATESDNLAIGGVVNAWIEKGIAPGEIVVCKSAIEHAAVSETADALKKRGVNVVTLATPEGVVDPKDIVVPENAKAIIVSAMYVNNEIGSVHPIKEIAKRVRFLRKHNEGVEILFHVDATQAPLHYSLTVPQLGIDMMTLGATKLYCPKGVGMLYVRRGVTLSPIMHGGGQERGLRPGTQPLALIHDFAHALSFAQKNREEYTDKVTLLQVYFENTLAEEIPEVVITLKDAERTPHITHVAIKNFDSELMVLELDARGIAVSAKSACKNEEDAESEIVTTLYGTNVGAIRFSFGRTTTQAHLDRAIAALKQVLEKYKS